MTEPRVIVALAAETEDDFIWRKLEDIVPTNMFSAGPLSVKFAYFGEEGAGAIRPLISTRWASDPDDMRALLDHARDSCVCGCYVDVESILDAALKETKERPVQAVVIFGDYFDGNCDDAFAYAKQLHAAGTRLFLFQQSNRRSQNDAVFRTLAEMTGGAFFEFNPAVERIAERLPRLLEAVTHYAIGGTDALEALANQSADLLLEQINRNTGALANQSPDLLLEQINRNTGANKGVSSFIEPKPNDQSSRSNPWPDPYGRFKYLDIDFSEKEPE